MKTIKEQLSNWNEAGNTVVGLKRNLRQDVVLRVSVGPSHVINIDCTDKLILEFWYRNADRGVSLLIHSSDISQNDQFCGAGALMDIATRAWLGKVIEHMRREETLVIKPEGVSDESIKLHLHQSMNQVMAGNMIAANHLWDYLEPNLSLEQFLQTHFDVV